MTAKKEISKDLVSSNDGKKGPGAHLQQSNLTAKKIIKNWTKFRVKKKRR